MNAFRHVNDPNFGTDTRVFDAEIARLQRDMATQAEQPNWIDTEILLRSVYESSFRIRDHYSSPEKQHPLALVAANPKEDFAPYSSRYSDMVTFVEERVYEATGISMDEFFRRPRADIELILAVVRQRNKKHASLFNTVANKANQDFSKA